MRKACKILVLVLLVFTVLLSASCEVQTTLNIDENFKGQRIIRLSVSEAEKNRLANINGANDLDSFIALARDECPDGMELDSITPKGGGGYLVTFIIEFGSLSDYRAKVAGILGREPKIEHEKRNSLFYPGYTLKEDFSSADLLKWAAGKLVEKGALNHASVSSIVHSETEVKLGAAIKETSDASKAKIDVDVTNPYEIYGITVTTTGLGGGLFERTVAYNIPESTENLLGSKDIEHFMQEFAPDGSTCGWQDGTTYEKGRSFRCFTISFSGDAKELGRKTGAALNNDPLSAVYSGDTSQTGAFETSGTLAERMDFSAWPVNKDGTCPVKLVYKTTDGTGISVSGSGWTVSEDGMAATYESANAGEIEAEIRFSAVFQPSSISIHVTQTGTDRFIRSFAVTYAEKETQYGADYLKTYLSTQSTEDVTYTADNNAEGFSRMTVSAEGSMEQLSAVSGKLFGESNTLQSSVDDAFSYQKKISVADTANFGRMLRNFELESPITYTFTAMDGSSVCNVTLSDEDGNTLQRANVGNGEKSMTVTAQADKFTVIYEVTCINYWFIAACVGGVIILLFIIILADGIRRKKKREKSGNAGEGETDDMKNSRKKNESLAEVNENRSGTETIVVESAYDDGLSLPGDESEGSWLFVNTIRILAAAAAVLFFLPFATLSIQKAVLGKDVWLTGLRMFFGGDFSLDIFGLSGKITYSGDIKSLLLIIIPLVIILIISVRKWIKPTIAYIFSGILAVSQIIYLCSVPSYIAKLVEAMRTQGSSSIEYELGWAYSWSVLIYILMAAALIIVLFAEFRRLRRVEKIGGNEEEYFLNAAPVPEAAETEEPDTLCVFEVEPQDGSTVLQEDTAALNNVIAQAIAPDEPEEEIKEEQQQVISASAEVVVPEPVKEQEPPVQEEEKLEDDFSEAENTEITPETQEEEKPARQIKLLNARIKPQKAVLPSQEELDENSGY